MRKCTISSRSHSFCFWTLRKNWHIFWPHSFLKCSLKYSRLGSHRGPTHTHSRVLWYPPPYPYIAVVVAAAAAVLQIVEYFPSAFRIRRKRRAEELFWKFSVHYLAVLVLRKLYFEAKLECSNQKLRQIPYEYECCLMLFSSYFFAHISICFLLLFFLCRLPSRRVVDFSHRFRTKKW